MKFINLYKIVIVGAILAILLWTGFALRQAYNRIARMKELRQMPAHIVGKMSLEEKVGQLFHVAVEGKTVDPTVEREIRNLHVGGIILFAKNLGTTEEIRKLNGDLQSLSMGPDASGIPLFISIDQEGGRVFRVTEGTVQFPGAMATGQADDEQLARDSGYVTGYELRKLGINLILAPDMDVNNNPANPIINTRSFGSDPDRVSRIGSAVARGIRESLSVPTIKHFPGHGDTNADSHLQLFRINRSLEELRKTELVPFRAAIQDGAEVVMSAHILFPSLDPENPATLSPRILKGLLRQELGYNGLIMTDAMEMKAISSHYPPGEAARKAFQAGADVLLLTGEKGLPEKMYSSLLEGFRSGELSTEDLNRAVERQITLKLRRGLFYTEGSKRFEQADLNDYFASLVRTADQGYEEIRKRYGSLEDLNKIISRRGIVSLRKPFAGIDPSSSHRARLFYLTEDLAQEAKSMGLAGIEKRGNLAVLAKRFVSRPADEPWIIEITNDDLAAWNRFVEQANALETGGADGKKSDANGNDKGRDSVANDRKRAPLIGLDAGNPFLDLRIPASGALLVSFSPTLESKRALLHRAVSGPVAQARLILSDPNGETGESASAHRDPK